VLEGHCCALVFDLEAFGAVIRASQYVLALACFASLPHAGMRGDPLVPRGRRPASGWDSLRVGERRDRLEDSPHPRRPRKMPRLLSLSGGYSGGISMLDGMASPARTP
jgi:hypothetical protein